MKRIGLSEMLAVTCHQAMLGGPENKDALKHCKADDGNYGSQIAIPSKSDRHAKCQSGCEEQPKRSSLGHRARRVRECGEAGSGEERGPKADAKHDDEDG